jgi:MFS family permease
MFRNFKQTFASLKIRNYRLYFIGQAISLVGSWMQIIAQDWLVLKITNSGTQLGIVSAFQFLPVLILGPLGGVIVDRFPKRKILFFTQTASGILALILGVLVITNLVQIWMIYILALCLGLINTVDNPTRNTFAPEMVGKDNLQNAIALTSVMINLARALGPVIAGVIIATLGLGPCFILNAASFLAGLTALFLMKKEELHIEPRLISSKGHLKEGFMYIKSSPILKNTILMMAIVGTFSYEFSVSLPLLAKFAFNGNAATYGFLTASTGFGSIFGGLLAASRKKISPNILVRYALLFGITLIIAAWMPNLIFSMMALFFAGIFSINFISLGNTTLQLESRPEMRGRVMSFWTMAFLGSTPIGGPIIGWIGEHWGVHWPLSIGGFAAVFAAIYGMMAFSKMNQVVTVPEDVKIRDEEIESESRTKI